MIEKQFFSSKRIIDCLNTDYGIRVTTLTFIPLGADLDASVYRAQAHDQSLYFVKLKRGHHHDTGAVIQLLLHDVGTLGIMAPIKTAHGQPTRHIDDFTLIVYPFIEGQDGFSRNLANDQWVALGTALKKLHEFNLSPLIKDQIKRESYSSQWREAVRSIYAHIDAQPQITDEVALSLLTGPFN